MLIGISSKMGKEIFGVTYPYLRYFKDYGMVLPFTPSGSDEELLELVNKLDVLVLTGGPDVSPLRYGEPPDLVTGNPDIFLEWVDQCVVPMFIKAGKPIIGICRGLQTINVIFGGTLYQHLDHPYSSEDRSKIAHSVVASTPVGVSKFGVNSLHHQGIKTLGEGLVSIAEHRKKDGDRVVEAIMHESLPIFAVQWHPEEVPSISSELWFSSRVLECLSGTLSASVRALS